MDVICLSGELSANKTASEVHSSFYDEYLKYVVDCFENGTVCELDELQRLHGDKFFGMSSCAF